MSKREEILFVAAKLFKDKGYSGTSIRDITSAVGILRGSIYSHFESKEEIFLTILHRGVDSLLISAEQIIDKKLSPQETLRKLVENHLIHIMENNNSLVIFIQEKGNISFKKISGYLKKRDYYERIFRDVISEGIKQGVFANLDIRLTVFSILGMCNWVVHWFNPNGLNSSKELSEQLASLICDHFILKKC